MLEFLLGKASERKLRLMLCNWSRLNWKWMPQLGRMAVEVAELFADGLVSDTDRRSADAELWWTTQGERKTLWWQLTRFTLEGSTDLWEATHASASANPKIKNRQSVTLHCIFGNPFHPLALDPAWLTWHDGLIISMARQMYDSRDFTDVPILADALEEAGCTNPDILTHCRSKSDHVRGCWVVDLLLRKE